MKENDTQGTLFKRFFFFHPVRNLPIKAQDAIPRKAEEKCMTEEQYKLQYCHEMALISTLIFTDKKYMLQFYT